MKSKILALLFAVALFAIPARTMANPYLYVSQEYGFSIECPQKPLGVIPLLDPGHPGEMLVFKNDGYTILQAWIISTNAFETKDMPDFNKMTPQQEQEYAENLKMNRGYQAVLFVPLHGQKVIYAITPKIVYVNTEKDGKKSTIAKNVAQRIETYIPGKRTNYAVIFMNTGNPDSTEIDAYQRGLLSFKEVGLPDEAKAPAAEAKMPMSKVKAKAKTEKAAKAPAAEAEAAAKAPAAEAKAAAKAPAAEAKASEVTEPSAVIK